GCGSEVVLETVDEPRAWVARESRGPADVLEQARRTNEPVTYVWRAAIVPRYPDPPPRRLYPGFHKPHRDPVRPLPEHSQVPPLRAHPHLLLHYRRLA